MKRRALGLLCYAEVLGGVEKEIAAGFPVLARSISRRTSPWTKPNTNFVHERIHVGAAHAGT